MNANHDSDPAPRPVRGAAWGGRTVSSRPFASAKRVDPGPTGGKGPDARTITAPTNNEEFGELVAKFDLIKLLSAVVEKRLAFEDAEEVVSDTLWCLAKRLERVSEAKPINNVVAFSVKVLRHKISKVHSKKKRVKVRFVSSAPELLAEIADRAAGSNIHEADRYAAVLAAAPDRLLGNVRRAFELVVIKGRTPKAAAAELGCHAGHVRRLLREAELVVEELVRKICT